jgi:putative oxidoreductase
MNWSGKQAGEGFEYHLLAIAIAAAVMVGGAGVASVDLALTGTRRGARPVREFDYQARERLRR